MSRYTKLKKTKEDDKECEEAMQNHVLTSVQPENTSNDEGEGDDEDQGKTGPKVATESDSREETLKRRLKKQKERQDVNKEKLDTNALLSKATELLETSQANESSSGNHVEIAKMKHKMEDIEETVDGLKGTVGDLNQTVQEMSNQLTGVQGLLQQIANRLDSL